MRKIITWLYNKYCKQTIDSAYIGGIQRDFTYEPNLNEEREMITQAKILVESKLFSYLINDELKKYTEIVLTKGETNESRDFAIYAINIILRIEDVFKLMADRVPEEDKEFDEYEIL